ncbi:MAG: PHP domain-containing protein [Candidatus Pacebacteria bacterium]|nr:PHP domain-containing protein [Candidatus Paceibacterota bacterium]
MLIDLQLHSTYSDGYLTPTELAGFISKFGIKIAALTDHNTVGGIDEFRNACATHNIQAVTGVEIYTYLDHHRFNVLWYNFDDTHPKLHTILRESQVRRRRLVRAALYRLEKHGFLIETERILDKYTHYIPLNHIIDDVLSEEKNRQLVKKELKIDNPQEIDVIQHYLRNRDIGKLRNGLINFERITKLRKDIGGQLVLCHPTKHQNHKTIDQNFWRKLHKLGMDGIETLSPHHSFSAIAHMQKIAREIGFIETGGSDFHKEISEDNLMKYSWQYFTINSNLLNGVEVVLKNKTS